MKKIIALCSLLFLTGCGEQSAVSAIEAHGFKNVKMSSGIVWWSCGHDDSVFYNSYFTATGMNGKPVNGTVCGSMFKGWTVRID